MRRTRTLRRAALLAVLASLAVACSSTTHAASSTTSLAAASGPVDVLYAASLVDLMEKQIGPAFHSATGYTFVGFSGASGALANQIKGGVRQGDVFISASPAVNSQLEGVANGNWVSWYATFASSPLVIGYNPHSKFAADLTSKPWYEVVTEKGFLVGRTDPATDPKGKLTATALSNEEATAPALRTIAASTGNVYPENTLVGRLQAGQLDAGFFYASEAQAAGIPTVALTGQTLKASYTITILNRAPHQAAAQAFVTYLLGAPGAAVLDSDGFHVSKPAKISGTGVPAAVQGALSS